jgi:hypothetical protein
MKNSKNEIKGKYYPEIRKNLDSQIGHKLKENRSFTLSGPNWKSKIETNNLGFRAPVDKGGTLFLGDSFTVSIRLNYEDTFLGLLEEEGRNINSLATGGWTTANEFYALKKYIEYYSPEEVVLVFYAQNDVWENFQYKNPMYEDSKIDQLPLGRSLIKLISKTGKLYCGLVKSGFVNPLRQFTVYQENYSSQIETGWEITEEYITKIKTFLDEKEVDLKIVSMPSPWQTSEKWRTQFKNVNEWAPNWHNNCIKIHELKFEKPESKLREICERKDIELVSLFNEINEKESPEKYYFESVDHYNKKGHKLVAEKLEEEIFSSGK